VGLIEGELLEAGAAAIVWGLGDGGRGEQERGG
jgi:hypothetical protein